MVAFFAACAAQADMSKDAKIYVAGHGGLVGSALVRRLEADGYYNIITATHKEVDLRNQQEVYRFFDHERPHYVFLAAAKVGGILANRDYPAEFIYDNLMIACNVINAAHHFNVKKLLFLGSSCIYPRDCPQPMREEYLLTSELEWTNEPYAIAKIAGIKLCQSFNRQYGTKFISCMPTNLYGPCDNFNLETSHVLPALMRKIYTAKLRGDKEFIAWGTGTPYREFLYVDDLADACLFLMNHYEGDEIVNIGTGVDVTIAELVELIKEAVGFDGEIIWDRSKPDGTPRKLLDVSRIKDLGWQAKVTLQEGLERTLDWCKEHRIFETC
jgi:GDP-L-fucose synthase